MRTGRRSRPPGFLRPAGGGACGGHGSAEPGGRAGPRRCCRTPPRAEETSGRAGRRQKPPRPASAVVRCGWTGGMPPTLRRTRDRRRGRRPPKPFLEGLVLYVSLHGSSVGWELAQSKCDENRMLRALMARCSDRVGPPADCDMTSRGTVRFVLGADYHLGDLLWLTAVIGEYRRVRQPDSVCVSLPESPVAAILESNPLIEQLER